MAISTPSIVNSGSVVAASSTTITLTVPNIPAGHLFMYYYVSNDAQTATRTSATVPSNQFSGGSTPYMWLPYIVITTSTNQYAGATITFTTASANNKQVLWAVADTQFVSTDMIQAGYASTTTASTSLNLSVANGPVPSESSLVAYFVTGVQATASGTAGTLSTTGFTQYANNFSGNGSVAGVTGYIVTDDTPALLGSNPGTLSGTWSQSQASQHVFTFSMTANGTEYVKSSNITNEGTLNRNATATASAPLASFRAASNQTASADTASPFADLTYTLPTGATTGDLLLALYQGKPFDTIASTPAGYSSIASFASGTTAQGTGIGSMRAQAFIKTHSGTESNPTSSFTAQYNPGGTAMLALSKSQAGSWSTYVASGGDDTATGTDITPTFSDFLPAVAGDILVIQMAIIDDTGDSTTITTLDIPGCYLGPVTQRITTPGTTAGNDMAMMVWTCDVISGSATDVPTLTATTGTTGDASASINLILVGPPGVGTRPPTTRTGSAATTVSPTSAAVGAKIHATTAVATTVAPTPAANAIETLFVTAGPNNNLVNNSSFETDVSGWFGTGSAAATLAQTSAVAFSGTKAAALTATVATGGIRMETAPTARVTAGVTYTLSAYMRAAALATTADVGIAFYDASGVIIGALTYGTGVTTTTSTWTRATYTVTAPAGAVTASLNVRPRNTATSTIGEVQYVDAVQFEVAGAATAYVAPTQTTVFPTPTAAGTVTTIQFGTATTTTVSPTPVAAATVTKPVTGLATTTSPTTAAAGTPAKTGIGLNTLADTIEAAAGVTNHIATTTATINPTPASAGVVTDSGAATATISPTPAANSTASRPLTGTQTLADTIEAAAGTVTKSTSAVAVTVAPIPAGNAVTNHIATTVTITTSPTPTAAAGGKTIPATATTTTVSPTTVSALGAVTHTVTGTATTSPTTVAAGVVNDEGIAAVTTTPSTAAAGVVLDEGTAATTVSGIPAAAGTVTDLGDATSTVTVTPVVSPQAMAKTTLATMVTSSPATTAIPSGTLKSSTAAVTVTPNSTWSGNAWGSQFMRPDVLLSVVGLTGIVEYIQDSPSTPDTNELAPTGGAVDVRFSFENHDQQLRALPNDQTIRVRLTSV